MNARTGAPVDLRQADTSIVFEARVREDDEPIIVKTFGVVDGAGSITVDVDEPGNEYTLVWESDDTAEIDEELLLFAVTVVEPDSEGDKPVHGVLALTSQ